MLDRVSVIALNTYREAVRAWVLLALFALALGTGGYALVVGGYSVRANVRVMSDVGSASISIYAIIVAVVLAATSLYRELELKTIFPILARPISRTEYLVGKYLGILLTLAVFIAADAGATMIALGAFRGQPLWLALGAAVATVGVAVLVGWQMPRWRTWLPIPWALSLLAVGWLLAGITPDDRAVVAGLSALALLEVCVVSSIAMWFASFSSPFLTAALTFGLFLVGRSADTLAHLPARNVLERMIHDVGVVLARVVPNLMIYVPPRTLLTGEAAGVSIPYYFALATAQAVAYSVGLMALASLVFRRRDFQ